MARILLRTARFRSFFVCVVMAIALGVGSLSYSSDQDVLGGGKMTIRVSSSAFENNRPIPKKYTGEGADVSPALAWADAPANTKEFVLICDDPDAPTAEPWVHWVMYKIPADVKSLPEGIPREMDLKTPAGAMQGKNSWPSDRIGYRGPMPPPGPAHHYCFHVYALDMKLALESGMAKETVLNAMHGHVLAKGELIGTYAR